MKYLTSVLHIAGILGLVLAMGCISMGSTSENHFKTYIDSTKPASRSRRQTTENDFKCTGIISKAYCSSSFAQNYINAISKCGEQANSDIASFNYSCAKNNKGKYCNNDLTISYIYGNCSTSSCSTGCRNALTETSCCVTDGTNSNTQYFSNCGLAVPSPCKSSLRIPKITQGPTCITSDDYGKKAFTAFCDNISPIISALKRDSDCEYVTNVYEAYCSIRNGKYCYLELLGDSPGSQSIENAQECLISSNDTSECCHFINDIKDKVGCCFHYSNLTDYRFVGSMVFNRNLWNQCNIIIPNLCNAASTNSISFINFMFTVFMSILWLINYSQ